MKQGNGISVRTILDTRRAKNNGLYPVKIRVIYKCVAKYYATNVDLSIDEWGHHLYLNTAKYAEIREHIG